MSKNKAHTDYDTNFKNSIRVDHNYQVRENEMLKINNRINTKNHIRDHTK